MGERKKSLRLTDCSGEHFLKLPFPKRSEQDCMLPLICVLHCLWEADYGLAEEKKVSSLGSPSTFSRTEASCSHIFVLLDPPPTLCTPFPLSPRGKTAWGPSAFTHIAPRSPALVQHAAGHQPARGSCLLQKATAIFGRGEGSCTAPTSPAAKWE